MTQVVGLLVPVVKMMWEISVGGGTGIRVVPHVAGGGAWCGNVVVVVVEGGRVVGYC